MAHITNFARISLWFLLLILAGISVVFTSAFLYLSPKLPSVDALGDVQLQTPLRIYTQDNQLIGEFGEKRRTPIAYEQVPRQFINAILAAEDDRFFSHHGVDPKGLLRAASQLIATGSIQSGGSTITMQVAKNYFLSHERTFSRKFNEIFLALQIEQSLSKEAILELYLNKIFLGNRAYGIEAAAKVYYGKPIGELDLAQLAMIAGLPKAPSRFNPIINPKRAKIRRDWILGRMRELGHIDDAGAQVAIDSPITAKYHGTRLNQSAPYIAEMTRKAMLERFGAEAYTAGYSVYTTVSANLQHAAQQAVINGLFAYDNRHGYRGPEQQFPPQKGIDPLPTWQKSLDQVSQLGSLVPAIVTAIAEESFAVLFNDGSQVAINWTGNRNKFRPYITVNRRGPRPQRVSDVVAVGDLVRVKQDSVGDWQLSQLPVAQAALVSVDSNNGAILSLVGGFDYNQSKFNRVTQATRQPGSNFKPFIYTAALDAGYTAASMINDAPLVFDDKTLESTWRPTNSNTAGGKFLGPTRLRQALYQSRNLVSIRLLRSLGINKAINYVGRFGFQTKQLPRDLSLALGSHSLTPIEIVNAYASIANGGYRVEPYWIERITSLNGDTIFHAQPDTVCVDCSQPPPSEEQELATLEDILRQNETLAEPPPQAERIVEERTAYIIDSMLKDVVKRGTGRKARVLKRGDLAGKTGTSNGPTDAWFSGYGGGIVTTTWVGFDKNGLLGNKEFGGSAALPIWIDFMKTALKDRPESYLKQPPGIVSVKIDPKTGLLARPGQKNATFELFREENVPQEGTSQSSDNNSVEIRDLIEDDIF